MCEGPGSFGDKYRAARRDAECLIWGTPGLRGDTSRSKVCWCLVSASDCCPRLNLRLLLASQCDSFFSSLVKIHMTLKRSHIRNVAH